MNNLHERIPPIEALREIAWSIWEPLNLRCLGWKEQGGINEYDSHIVRAAEMLARGAAGGEVIEYLIYIETKHMGMEGSDTASVRATMAVEAISALISKGAWNKNADIVRLSI